ncbi:MAG: hypothetical protein CUN55_11130 [Phototrophicales bacterium]|nr:MAG: hypothetical protein CUN55_11130 [Phototrophicales bacterium]
MEFSRQADVLRTIASRLGLPDFRTLTQNPTIHEAVRLTIYYHLGNAPDSVSTLLHGHHQETCQLHICFDRPQKRAELHLNIKTERYNQLLLAMQKANFDKLDDDPTLPFYGADLWLIERAAGSFHHDVVLAPESATGNYRELVRAFQTYLPETTRVGAQ